MSKSSRHTRELGRRLSKLTEVQAAVGWGLILLVIALLGVIYLNQSSRIAAVGRRVQTLQYDLVILQRENAEIERDIALSQSITDLQEKAKRMGFVKPQPGSIDYLVVPNYPPATTVTEEEPLVSGNPKTVDSTTEALWLVVENRLNELMRGESREQ